MYKNSIWAKNILEQQKENGLWGLFHTLSEPTKKPITTEQALRRLEVLGYTIEDRCVRKTVDYMHDCLLGNKEMPDIREKTHDWELFTELMLATWIRRFTKECDVANRIADKWASIISEAFKTGSYSHTDYLEAYEDVFSKPTRGSRFTDFVSFYQVSLVSDRLTPEIESFVFDYIINREKGIYYLGYNKALTELPDDFRSKQASKFLSSLEIIAAYKSNRHKLGYAIEWIKDNMNLDETWDLGSKAKDNIYLPLSDSWRSKKSRVEDCTYKVKRILDILSDKQ